MSYPTEELHRVAEAVERLGSQNKAAKELGLSRRALQRRLYAYRESNTEFLDTQAQDNGFDPDQVNHYWVKTKQGSFHVKKDTEVDYNQLRESFLRDAAEYAPKYHVDKHINVKNDNEKNLIVLDIADLHINKLALREETGQEYNIDIATSRMREGINKLIGKAIPHGIDKIAFIIGNDILNSDTTTGTTTGGTAQNNETVWWKAFKIAKMAYVSAIEELANYATVHIIFNPSNHDYVSGFMLADSISSWFRNHPNVVTEDGSMSIAHRKYIQYGDNLIGFTHADFGKEADLPNLMQYEAREVWGRTKFAYWYTHHRHIKDRKIYGKKNYRIEKDHLGVTIMNAGKGLDPSSGVFVEIVRSPSSADAWHSRSGYLGSAAVECFIHHESDGQVARFTHYF
jgi:hypothetical protein